MDEEKLMNAVLFAEGDKSSLKNFTDDATGIMSLVDNRKNNPKRWGQDSWGGVVLDQGEFSSIGSNEFNKAMSGQLTKEEEIFLKKAAQIRKGFETGMIKPTHDGDHMQNPIDKPNAWNTRTSEKDVKEGEMYYQEVGKSRVHTFRKETQKLSSKQKSIKNVQKLLNSKGYSLEEDGIQGEQTIQAVMDFQRKNGLKADGIAGKNTLAALQKSE
jgi:hypothetical protein